MEATKNSKRQYMLSANNQLLLALKVAGVDPSDAVGYLGEQVLSMMEVPANFPKGRTRLVRRRGKSGDPMGRPMGKSDLEVQVNDMWIMRGYYPGTTCMFKISLIHYIPTYVRESLSDRGEDPTEEDFEWLARCSLVIPGNKEKNHHFSSETIEKYLLNKTLETSIFGDTTTESLKFGSPNKGERQFFLAPRTMSPAGIKLKKRKT